VTSKSQRTNKTAPRKTRRMRIFGSIRDEAAHRSRAQAREYGRDEQPNRLARWNGVCSIHRQGNRGSNTRNSRLDKIRIYIQ